MIQVAQILFILSVLVILHEFGHYLAAKIFKVRVEKFYLFMDAGFSLVKKKIGETEWGIGWLPIGGYVKLSGMIDESMDVEQMNNEPEEWEFRAKPAWQRLIIMLGGIIVNIVLAWLIYTIMYSTVGKKVISTEELQKNGLAFGQVGQSVGFKNGDKIISIDGKSYDDFKYMTMGVLFGDKVQIERDGKPLELLLTDEQKGEIIKKEGRSFAHIRFNLNNVFIDSVGKNNSGIQRFDELVGINNQKLTYLDEFDDAIKKHVNDSLFVTIKRDNKEIVLKTTGDSLGIGGLYKNIIPEKNYLLNTAHVNSIEENSLAEQNNIQFKDVFKKINGNSILTFKDLRQSLSENKEKEIVLTVLRKDKNLDLKINLKDKKRLGVGFENNEEKAYSTNEKFSFISAFPEAVKQSWLLFEYNIQSFKLIAKPKTGAYTQVKSPVGIARMLPDEWNWEFIWNFTALFSIGLAFMNLLPIPGLDGGHALFTIVEMITGKTLSVKAAERVQTFGMIILLTLMALTFGKDIYQLIVDKLFS